MILCFSHGSSAVCSLHKPIIYYRIEFSWTRQINRRFFIRISCILLKHSKLGIYTVKFHCNTGDSSFFLQQNMYYFISVQTHLISPVTEFCEKFSSRFLILRKGCVAVICRNTVQVLPGRCSENSFSQLSFILLSIQDSTVYLLRFFTQKHTGATSRFEKCSHIPEKKSDTQKRVWCAGGDWDKDRERKWAREERRASPTLHLAFCTKFLLHTWLAVMWPANYGPDAACVEVLPCCIFSNNYIDIFTFNIWRKSI